ncbi:MAG: hypothetical protein COS95_06070 [Ignavibacteriales bacterium CG07_land_8_20_14_0_80_59_12]|nr:MAG: hypothetical protein COS95_06070 [Ignavibacteriales bacterium CG07_land_8_20_14_0_80_59_12]
MLECLVIVSLSLMAGIVAGFALRPIARLPFLGRASGERSGGEGAAGGRSEDEVYQEELLRGVLDMRGMTVREIMVPRPEVFAVDIHTSRDELLELLAEEGYSRVPVYDGTIDNVLGVIYTKDLLALLQHRNVIVLEDIVRPAYFVPETKRLGALLREMQTQHIHLALVIDEYGGVEGIVTLEDILEEIVGEIRDEYDEEPEEIIEAQDGGFLVDARMTVRRLNERFGEVVAESDGYDTIAGFVVEQAGRIPRAGETFRSGPLRIAVTRRSQTAVKQVKIWIDSSIPE